MSAPAGADLETALLQAGVLLLNGWGFNWYRTENLLRADDIVLRNRADALLGDALAAFRGAEAAFRRAHVVVGSRDPQAQGLDQLGELRVFQAAMAELDSCRTRLRGASVPPPDRITWRAGNEAELLTRLGRCDAVLAGLAQALREDALAAVPAGSAAAGLAWLVELAGPHMRLLNGALDERAQILALMQG